MIFYPCEKNSKRLPNFWHCIASSKWNLSSNKKTQLRTTKIDSVDPSVHDVRTAGVSYRWYSVNVLVDNFQQCCLVYVSVCVSCDLRLTPQNLLQWGWKDTVLMRERARGRKCVRKSSCILLSWLSVNSCVRWACVCVRVCAQGMMLSMRENTHSWLVIYSAQTTLGTEDRQTGCVCYRTAQWCVGGGGGLRDRAGRGKRGDRRQRSPCPSPEVTELYCAHLCAAL